MARRHGDVGQGVGPEVGGRRFPRPAPTASASRCAALPPTGPAPGRPRRGRAPTRSPAARAARGVRAGGVTEERGRHRSRPGRDLLGGDRIDDLGDGRRHRAHHRRPDARGAVSSSHRRRAPARWRRSARRRGRAGGRCGDHDDPQRRGEKHGRGSPAARSGRSASRVARRPSDGASDDSRARVTPGRMRPSAGGVRRRSPSSSQRLAQPASRTWPSSSQISTTLRRTGAFGERVEMAAVTPFVRAQPAADGDRHRDRGDMLRRAGAPRWSR